MQRTRLKARRQKLDKTSLGPVSLVTFLGMLAALAGGGIAFWLRTPLLQPHHATVRPDALVMPPIPQSLPAVPEVRDATDEWADKVTDLNQQAAELASAGKFAAAVELLGRALTLRPQDQVLTSNLQATFINWGYTDLRAESFPAAISSFIKAQAFGDRVEIERGLGYSYYRQGRYELARVALERAVVMEPTDEESYVTLGQTFLKLRDHGSALEAFERALELGSTYPGVATTVAKLRRDADTELGYRRLESSHFTIKFEGEENLLAGRTILNGLEEAYRTVGARFGYYPVRRLEAVLYTDQVFEEVMSSPRWSGAIFDGRIRIPVRGLTRGSERLQRTLRHEYAHSVILEMTRGRLPAWLNEGLAQLCEGDGDRGRGAYLRRLLAEGDLVPLSELERPFIGLSKKVAKLAYAEAYFAAQYLTEIKSRYNVARLLKRLAQSEDFPRKFKETLNLSYDSFDERFRAQMYRRFGPKQSG